ncbi:MAG TPA: hypothetical protein VII99_08175 [Bacteroidia bacterium]
MITISKAQDATLPQGNCQIRLSSGNVIQNVHLWNINTEKVEFLKDGDKGELNISEVKQIESPYYLLTFNDEHQLVKRHFDCIIPYYGDTIWGIIEKTDQESIWYVPAGSVEKKVYMKTGAKSYLQWEMPANNINPSSYSTSSEKKPSSTDQNKYDDYYSSIDRTNKHDDSYYEQSYQRGVTDASRTSAGGWSTGGFCLGATGCFPIISLSALNSDVNIHRIPNDVDERLYTAGYRNQVRNNRVKAASQGALAALGVLVALTVASILTTHH